ncbi:hypothetical protein NDU88_006862 [Pleurodeles waltl]|uniref:Uncharacterized protein n=1 Tax=Pleurodeles waltl TaxID=8319 RepID=A0AAV7SQX0_PLEWA|nr:hypothetical protein NDU88_006862 [Pleurodeles waltl]
MRGDNAGCADLGVEGFWLNCEKLKSTDFHNGAHNAGLQGASHSQKAVCEKAYFKIHGTGYLIKDMQSFCTFAERREDGSEGRRRQITTVDEAEAGASVA